MRTGIDVSEHNGQIDWEAIRDEGIDFAIIRLGYGDKNLDEMFYENINGAIDAGLEVGVYYYSYALNREDAEQEAHYLANILIDCGMTMDRLPMGVWFDMEDADGFKRRNGAMGPKRLTDMCVAFIETCKARGFDCGVYSSLSWLEDRLDTDRFGDAPIWCAQWETAECEWDGAKIWQFTDDLEVDGKTFDGNFLMEV